MMKTHAKSSRIAYSEVRTVEHRRGTNAVELTVKYMRDGSVSWSPGRLKKNAKRKTEVKP